MNQNKLYDVIIIGGGPAGYTAAIYCARAGFDTVVLEEKMAGGQMCLTMEIDNYPGFEEGVDGFTLGHKMQQGAQRFGAESVQANVQSVSLQEQIKVVRTDKGEFHGKTIIIASGAEHRHLGIAKEEELTGKGVSYCAACDGMLYRGKIVVVVGGGSSAAADALLLSRVCEKVFLVHRRDTLRAERVYHTPLMQAENVEFKWNAQVTELLQNDRLSGVTIKNIQTGEMEDISCQGLFISIGRAPTTGFLQGQVDLDEVGYVVADETTRTSIPGVFAVGDVRTKPVRQIVTATADGATAAHFVEEYLASVVFSSEIR